MALGSDWLGRDALRLAVTVMLMHSFVFCLDLNYQSGKKKGCLIELIGGKKAIAVHCRARVRILRAVTNGLALMPL